MKHKNFSKPRFYLDVPWQVVGQDFGGIPGHDRRTKITRPPLVLRLKRGGTQSVRLTCPDFCPLNPPIECPGTSGHPWSKMSAKPALMITPEETSKNQRAQDATRGGQITSDEPPRFTSPVSSRINHETGTQPVTAFDPKCWHGLCLK
jgi:hypothetical protein